MLSDTQPQSEENAILCLSSKKLPDGVTLEISHKRDVESILQPTQLNYIFFEYVFSDNLGNTICSKSYLDKALRATIYFNEQSVNFDNPTAVRQLLIAAYLTLNVLGFNRVTHRAVDLQMEPIDISQDDIADWAIQMDVLERKNAN